MKIQKIATLVALGAVALMIGVRSAGASTTIVSLDGHCDLISLTVFPWHQAGMSQVCNGVMTGVGAGAEGRVKSFVPKGLSIGEVYSPGPPGTVYLWTFQYPLRTGGTWSIYSTTCDACFAFVDSGTYTVTNAAAARDAHKGPSAIPAMQK